MLKESTNNAAPRVRLTIINFMQLTTLHGIPNIIRSERTLLKLIWGIAFIVSTCACAYMVIKTFTAYLDFEVVTKINVANELPAVFPAVSFCNIHPFTTNKSFEYLKTLFEKYNLSNDFDTEEYNLSYDYKRLRFDHFFYRFLGLSNSYFLSKEEKIKLSLPFNQTVISCSFGINDCYESDFEWSYSRLFGNCYLFNGGRLINSSNNTLRTSSKTGKINGLSIALFVGFQENAYSFDANMGAHLFIQNQSKPITPFEGLDIAPSFETNIHLKRFFINKLSKPYSNCVKQEDSFDSRYFNLIKSSGFMYKQIDCFDLCFQDYLIAECKCYNPGFNDLDYKVPCINPNQTKCEFDAFDNFTNKDSVDRCLPMCPLECNSADIIYTTSFSQFPTKSHAKNILKLKKIQELFNNRTNVTLEELKSSLLNFNVFYDDFKVIIIDESPKMLIEDLFSNIGGNLGLFLGISFLSFIEILEILFELLLIGFNRKSKVDIKE
jgi:hypothetical protein